MSAAEALLFQQKMHLSVVLSLVLLWSSIFDNYFVYFLKKLSLGARVLNIIGRRSDNVRHDAS